MLIFCNLLEVLEHTVITEPSRSSQHPGGGGGEGKQTAPPVRPSCTWLGGTQPSRLLLYDQSNYYY